MTVKSFSRNVATLSFVGYLPIAPGTWGSGVALVAWWFMAGALSLSWKIGVVVLLLPIAFWSAHQAEKLLGHDAKPIVIDEVVGQWVTLLFASHEPIVFVAGFIFFRLFDVLKPFPVYQSQRLPGGYGIVVDDLLAGLYAGVVLVFFRKVFLG